jgi:putative GTP pyrophosphokinase
MQNDLAAIRADYETRLPFLNALGNSLESELSAYLGHLHHVDRITFRAKGVTSFLRKAGERLESGRRKYTYPLEEIEDQVAGRVLVFYRRDIDEVLAALEGKWRKAEQQDRKPREPSRFEYETTHRVCVITPDLYPEGWNAIQSPPTTFELQIRTLAQHAWSEPQHNVYKARGGLSAAAERKLYWAAASAWGIDSIWEDLNSELREIDKSSHSE